MTWRQSYRQPPDWKRTRREVLEAAHYRCAKCGAFANTVDHKVPVAQGGTHGRGNLQAMCKSCHWKKTRAEQAAARQRASDADVPGRADLRKLAARIARTGR